MRRAKSEAWSGFDFEPEQQEEREREKERGERERERGEGRGKKGTFWEICGYFSLFITKKKFHFSKISLEI